MATMGNEKLEVKCRCCLKYSHHNDLTEPYETGVREVYSKMFLDCFSLVLSTSTELINFICSSCIRQLNDALEFKTMVAESERQLLSEIGSDKTVSSKNEELGLHSELDIKTEDEEEANEESQDCSMDFDDAVNDNDIQCAGGGAQEEEYHIAVVSQGDDVSAWSFDNTVGKEEVKTEGEAEEDMNRHSAASNVREGSPPTNKLVMKKNGTSEKHQTVEHIAASNGTNNYISNKSDKTNIIYQSEEDKDNQTVISTKIYDDAVSVTNNELLDNIEAQDKREKAKKYSCTTCKYTTNTASLLKSHLQAHAAVRSYICDSCCYIATTKRNIINHLKIHIGIKPFACKKCDKKFTVRNQLIRHVRMPFACEICDREFSVRSNLNTHIRIHTGEKPFACEICDTKFSQKATLNNHLRIHTVTKPFACEICDEKFSRRGHLKKHVKIHTGEKLFACEICDEKFLKRVNFNSHVRIHTGEKPFACEICDEKFSQRSNLNCHVRIHTGEKPFACEICDRKFSQKATLNNHLRIHTGEKPFACEICDKKFSRMGHLNKHVKIHTGEKRFACEICDKKFLKRVNFNSHVRIHTGEKPFAC